MSAREPWHPIEHPNVYGRWDHVQHATVYQFICNCLLDARENRSEYDVETWERALRMLDVYYREHRYPNGEDENE